MNTRIIMVRSKQAFYLEEHYSWGVAVPQPADQQTFPVRSVLISTLKRDGYWVINKS